MKKTLKEISGKITSVAFNLREDAGYSDSWTDGGASVLEDALSIFINGVKTGANALGGFRGEVGDYLFDIPTQWVKYFIEEDEEYKEYLRLKTKFEKKF